MRKDERMHAATVRMTARRMMKISKGIALCSIVAAVGGVGGTGGVGGCSSSKDRELAVRPVTVSEFGTKPAATTSTVPASTPSIATEDQHTVAAGPATTSPTTSPTTAPMGEAVATGGSESVPVTTGAAGGTGATGTPGSVVRPERPLQPGDQVVIDRVVGQVSGRPIFADAMLEPIGDRLAAESQRVSGQQFINAAQQIINQQMTEEVLNELFKAEAEASLTEQQKMGLLAFIRDFQEKQTAGSGGSRSQLEAELRRQGITVEDMTQAERDRVLIGNLLNEKIEPRVIVSWKDVEREYERRRAEFNPPATVTFQRVRLSTVDDVELIEKVKTRLAAGESFEVIFKEIGEPAATSMEPVQLGPNGMGDVPLNPAYQEALKGLTLGQTTKAIELEGRIVWLHVAAVDQPQVKTLYDVQRQLAQELYVRRRDEQRQIYMKSLFEKGIYDELDEMLRRVLTVAIMRYGR